LLLLSGGMSLGDGAAAVSAVCSEDMTGGSLVGTSRRHLLSHAHAPLPAASPLARSKLFPFLSTPLPRVSSLGCSSLLRSSGRKREREVVTTMGASGRIGDVHSSRFDDGARSPAAGGRQEGGPQQLLETTKNKRARLGESYPRSARVGGDVAAMSMQRWIRFAQSSRLEHAARCLLLTSTRRVSTTEHDPLPREGDRRGDPNSDGSERKDWVSKRDKKPTRSLQAQGPRNACSLWFSCPFC
jgi:hypothetical protein